MNVLFLSHCVPNPPDKGERIRAHQVLKYLAERSQVHLACLARSPDEVKAALELEKYCASVHAEAFNKHTALVRGFADFALGGCLTQSYYGSGGLRRHVQKLAAKIKFDLTVAYSVPMAPLAPAGVPMLLDMVDVDSEKWNQYAQTRTPGFAYAMEGRRLRREESNWARRAAQTFLCTQQELALFKSFDPLSNVECVENGVDLDYFNPENMASMPAAEGKRVLLFTGVMNYYPNSEGACRFAREVFAPLRSRNPDLEFWIVGRTPDRAVQALSQMPGVVVTGSVPDIRPYLRSATAVVVPLAIARGIQNKVLEALSMGKVVLASDAVCATFGDILPAGVLRCGSGPDVEARLSACTSEPVASIRDFAKQRFAWQGNLESFWSVAQRVAGTS